MSTTKYFKCFSAKIAQYLCRKGFNIVKTEVNFKNPRYNVFCFEDTQELREVFDQYMTSTNQHKRR